MWPVSFLLDDYTYTMPIVFPIILESFLMLDGAVCTFASGEILYIGNAVTIAPSDGLTCLTSIHLMGCTDGALDKVYMAMHDSFVKVRGR